ncbi:MAG: hypothetical protein ABSF34_18365, partial [Verrucomicrobiota bacterium]
GSAWYLGAGFFFANFFFADFLGAAFRARLLFEAVAFLRAAAGFAFLIFFLGAINASLPLHTYRPFVSNP